MARAGYQYETSPRKLQPTYRQHIDDQEELKLLEQKKQKAKVCADEKRKQVSKETKQNKELNKARFGVFYKSVLLFALLFFMLFRNSEIGESFSKIQALKAEITTIQKENDQLEISIQNSLNINHIEQAAKELLGMQKLTNRQTVYITLPKKDYVEHRAEEVVIEEKNGVVGNLIDMFKNLFN